MCTLFWVMTLCLMIYLRVRAKQLQKRELAESVEDARIFASANRIVDGGFPQPQMNGHGKETKKKVPKQQQES